MALSYADADQVKSIAQFAAGHLTLNGPYTNPQGT
jgi:hypothetical protein